jgi:outer membrane protein, multidrug efflux system
MFASLLLLSAGPICGCVVQPPAKIEEAMLPAGALPPASSPDAMKLQQRWWRKFQDAQLNDLMSQALSSAPDLAVARSRVDQGNAALQLALANTGVRIGAGAELSRIRISQTGVAGTASDLLIGTSWYDLGNLGINLAVALDPWGRRKAEIAAGVGRARAAAAESQMAELVITSGLARSYFLWQTDSERLAVANELILVLERLRALQARLVAQGLAPEISLADTTIQIDNARELAATMSLAQEFGELSMAAMLGMPPDERLPLQSRRLSVDSFHLPEKATISEIAQRPDLMARRWMVEAAVHDVAQARTAYFPDFRLSALAGLSSTELSEVLDPASRIFHVGGAVYLPVFDASLVRARYGVTRAQMELAIADYNAALASAIKEATQAAAGLRTQEARYAIAAHRAGVKRKSHSSAHALAQQGIQDERAVLQAQAEILLESEVSLRIQGEVAGAYLQLMTAMGGAAGISSDRDSSAAAQGEENARLE